MPDSHYETRVVSETHIEHYDRTFMERLRIFRKDLTIPVIWLFLTVVAVLVTVFVVILPLNEGEKILREGNAAQGTVVRENKGFSLCYAVDGQEYAIPCGISEKAFNELGPDQDGKAATEVRYMPDAPERGMIDGMLESLRTRRGPMIYICVVFLLLCIFVSKGLPKAWKETIEKKVTVYKREKELVVDYEDTY